jgi:DNA topoisomerase I
MARLHRVDCGGPGIRRVRRGRGFAYRDEEGDPVTEDEVLERIRALSIPPAWTEVWICLDSCGHIQATGHDNAGRKQYLYHDRWREHRDREKFEQMVSFARALPALRERVERDLARRGLVRERVLACALRLLDLGLFRIGSERYASSNGTQGLATLERSHVRLERGRAVFDYNAKGSQRHHQVVADPVSLPTVRALVRRRANGPNLLAYRNAGTWHPLRSDEINEHLKDLTGADYSAKDFRTWNATVLAAVSLAAVDPPPASKSARRRAITEAVKRVAGYLANTPAVCRNSYIDPRVIDRFNSGETIQAELTRIVNGSEPDGFPDRERIEAAVLRLID